MIFLKSLHFEKQIKLKNCRAANIMNLTGYSSENKKKGREK